MKTIGIILTTIIISLLWAPFFAIVIQNELNPNPITIAIMLESLAFSIHFGFKFANWFISNIK